jgi:hypothetical protein
VEFQIRARESWGVPLTDNDQSRWEYDGGIESNDQIIVTIKFLGTLFKSLATSRVDRPVIIVND